MCGIKKTKLKKKKFIIDGNKFNDLSSFYDHIDKVLTKDLKFKTGHNLDAFNDILRGGFGMYDYKEHIVLEWISSEKSKVDLGYEATIKWFEERIKFHNESSDGHFTKKLNQAKLWRGQTLYDMIIEIIIDHVHISF